MGVRRDPRRKNRWYYEFWIGPKTDPRNRHRGYPKINGEYVRDKRQAEIAEQAAYAVAKAERGMARSGIVAGGYMLGQAIDRHVSNLVDVSDSHRKSLERIGSEMLHFFGLCRPIADIRQDGDAGVDAYRKFLQEQPRKVWMGGPRKMRPGDHTNPALWRTLDRKRSASEVNHCLDLLRCAFTAAHKIVDPMTGKSALPFPPEVKAVPDPDRDPTPMSHEEYRARLATAPIQTVQLAGLAWWFGLRKAEAAMLEIRHVDWENECLVLGADENKSKKPQRIFGGDRGWILIRWLVRQARRRGTTRLVTWAGTRWARQLHMGRVKYWQIPAEDWRPLKSTRKAWDRTVERAAIEHPKRFHDVRAAYITNAAKLGSSSITKGLARHASMATTERYIKIVDRDLAEAADRAARARRRLRVVK